MLPSGHLGSSDYNLGIKEHLADFITSNLCVCGPSQRRATLTEFPVNNTDVPQKKWLALSELLIRKKYSN